MKTTITTIIICVSLYAGIGSIKNTTNSMTSHNTELNNAIVAMRGN